MTRPVNLLKAAVPIPMPTLAPPTAPTTYQQFLLPAATRVRETGARLTQPRTAVLAALLAADTALTHQEVLEWVAPEKSLDRVTVYRVLEWLVECQLAHRIQAGDRVWRFSANQVANANAAQSFATAFVREPLRVGLSAQPAAHDHAHFLCTSCGKAFCLPEMPRRFAINAPEGSIVHDVAVTVRGLCTLCAKQTAKPRSPKA